MSVVIRAMEKINQGRGRAYWELFAIVYGVVREGLTLVK